QIKKAGVDFKKEKKSKQAVASDHSIPKPMLAKLVDQLPSGGTWIYEKKYDGFRILSICDATGIYLYSRNGKSMNHLFPSLLEELSRVDRQVCIDGELAIEDKAGRPRFQLIASGEPVPSNLHLRYYVFDLLRLEGENVTAYELTERKDLLALFLRRIAPKTIIQPVEELKAASKDILQQAEKHAWEGIVAKEKHSSYLEG